MRLAGQVAFVTGAADGQGRTHALRLAEEGADIIGVDLQAPDDEAFSLTQKLVRATGRRMVARQADVRSLVELEAALADGVAELGRLDVVVANAGVLRSGSLADMTEADWQFVFDVNVTGAWLTCRAAVPHVVAGGRGGSIVLTSSLWGLKSIATLGAYAASKHAVVGIMRTLAAELGPHRIRVNSVHPTTVDTRMLRDLTPPGVTWEQHSESWKGMHLLPVAYVEPEDVSNAIVFLASDEARFITGAVIPVDAGALAK